jgi:hypothetical protein
MRRSIAGGGAGCPGVPPARAAASSSAARRLPQGRVRSALQALAALPGLPRADAGSAPACQAGTVASVPGDPTACLPDGADSLAPPPEA